MYFQTKEGTNLSGRKQVIDFMQKNNYTEEEIKEFATDTAFMNGCKEDAMLPDGWKYKKVKESNGKKIFMFLLPNSINFMGKQTVLEYMKKNKIDDSNSEKVINFVNKSKSKDHTWQSDETVPEGWKYRMVNAKNGRKVMFFQTREGTNLSGRVQAIDFTKKNNYPEK